MVWLDSIPATEPLVEPDVEFVPINGLERTWLMSLLMSKVTTLLLPMVGVMVRLKPTSRYSTLDEEVKMVDCDVT